LQIIDKFLSCLESGQWCSFQDVIDCCLLLESKFESVLSFLSEYNFIEVDDKKQKVRLDPHMMTFINGLHKK
jgi:hypothetical protein